MTERIINAFSLELDVNRSWFQKKGYRVNSIFTKLTRVHSQLIHTVRAHIWLPTMIDYIYKVPKKIRAIAVRFQRLFALESNKMN